MTGRLEHLLTVRHPDPTQARRGRLLSVLLLATGGVTAIGVVNTLAWCLVLHTWPTDAIALITGGAVLLFSVVGLFFLNRFVTPRISASIFLIALVAVASFSDTPEQLVGGRTTWLYVLPILMASFLLHPAASLALTVLSIVALHLISSFYGLGEVALTTAFGFFLIALVSWLAASNLERALEREVELSRMKSELISMASHELRTPIAAIQGYTEKARIMLTTLPGGDALAGDMQRALYNCKRLGTLVEALLAQARLQGGMFTLDEGPVAVREVLNDLLSTVGLAAQDKGLALTVEVDEGVPAVVIGDRKALLQVLVNLVDNGIKFTERGSVAVRVSRPDPAHWTLAVTDTGIGIPENARELIFEPFRTAHSVITRKHQGAGLGLSIVREFARVMGGKVTVESEEGRGSTFTVTLPLREG